MTPTETVQLTAYISQGCPQQAIDEFTADVWHDLLGDLGLAECEAAARRIMTAKPFVAPCDIIAEVKRERRKQAERARSERAVAPARAARGQLDDPRPLRETIRAIVARYGRPELTGGDG